jgi:hypothetical protein
VSKKNQFDLVGAVIFSRRYHLSRVRCAPNPNPKVEKLSSQHADDVVCITQNDNSNYCKDPAEMAIIEAEVR